MSLRRFYYLAPKDMQTLYAPVTSSDVEDTYTANWLTHGHKILPVRFGNTGFPSFSTANPPKDVNCVALINSNLAAGITATVSGDVDAELTMPAYHGDEYPLNPYVLLDPTVPTVETLAVEVDGNPRIVVIGQFVAGLARVLDLFEQGGAIEPVAFNKSADPQMGNIEVYDQGKAARKISGTARVTPTDALAILDWFWSTRDGLRFGLIIPDSTVNDIWAVKFTAMPQVTRNGGLVSVTLAFQEIPRKVWLTEEVAT